MISDSGAFFALDLGSATTSVALLGHLGGRWRLLAHAAAPSYVEPDALLHDLLRGIAGTDPEMLQEIAGGRSADPAALAADLPRLIARSTPPRHIVVLAGSQRQRRLLELAAYRSGWLVSRFPVTVVRTWTVSPCLTGFFIRHLSIPSSAISVPSLIPEA